MQREPLKVRAEGRWPTILSSIGIPSKHLRNKHGPCPMCGGKDRFRFDDKAGRGTWICAQCGAGDGIEMVKQFLRIDFKAAAEEIEKHVGSAPISKRPEVRTAENDQQTRETMRRMWERSQPITTEDAAGKYLHARTGATTFPDYLRFAKDERYSDGGKPSWHPVMLAKVDPCDTAIEQGERAALHRTYLDGFGGKADVPTPRKMMGTMPTGGAVRLMPHDGTLGIAEGIETAIAASVLFNMPVWAALTAGLLHDWLPPVDARMIFVLGDNDASHTGQAAAYGLAQKLRAKGLDVLVEIPSVVGQDWNDILLAKGRAA